nr:restriction endonuclease subunit S [Enterococcus cecorum]
MDDKMHAPQIRFSGFSNDWEQRKITELGKIYIGLVTTMTEHYVNKGTLLIRNSDIKEGKFEFGENPIFLDESFSEKNKSRMHQIGDVITVHTGDIGTSAVITERESNSIGFATIVTRPKKEVISSQYLCTFLNTEQHKKWALSVSTGDGRNNYNLKDYYRLKVPTPSIEEQQCISDFVGNLDTLIALHQRKLDKLINIKKSMLEKMFVEKNTDMPEIRFKGFTDTWEQRKLGEVADIIGGGTPDTSNPNYWNGNIDWYSPVEIGNNIYISDSIKKITELGLQKSSAKLLPIGTVLFTSRAGIGNTAILSKEGCTNQGFQSIIPHQGILNSYFIFSKTAELKKYGERVGAGSTFVEVSGKQMRKMSICIPSYVEQQRIGHFFETLDKLITLHQRKLEKLNNIKTFCLEKMFV